MTWLNALVNLTNKKIYISETWSKSVLFLHSTAVPGRPLEWWSQRLANWNVRNCQNASWRGHQSSLTSVTTKGATTQEINQNMFPKRVSVRGCHLHSRGSFSLEPTAEYQQGSAVSPQQHAEIVMSGVKSYFHFFWLVVIKPKFSVNN